MAAWNLRLFDTFLRNMCFELYLYKCILVLLDLTRKPAWTKTDASKNVFFCRPQRGGQVLKNYLNNAENLGTEAGSHGCLKSMEVTTDQNGCKTDARDHKKNDCECWKYTHAICFCPWYKKYKITIYLKIVMSSFLHPNRLRVTTFFCNQTPSTQTPTANGVSRCLGPTYATSSERSCDPNIFFLRKKSLP